MIPATVPSEKRYDGVDGIEGRRRVKRSTREVAKKAENVAHNGIIILLIRIMFSKTILSDTKPSLLS